MGRGADDETTAVDLAAARRKLLTRRLSLEEDGKDSDEHDRAEIPRDEEKEDTVRPTPDDLPPPGVKIDARNADVLKGLPSDTWQIIDPFLDGRRDFSHLFDADLTDSLVRYPLPQAFDEIGNEVDAEILLWREKDMNTRPGGLAAFRGLLFLRNRPVGFLVFIERDGAFVLYGADAYGDLFEQASFPVYSDYYRKEAYRNHPQQAIINDLSTQAITFRAP